MVTYFGGVSVWPYIFGAGLLSRYSRSVTILGILPCIHQVLSIDTTISLKPTRVANIESSVRVQEIIYPLY